MNSILNGIYSVWNQIVYAVSSIRIPYDIIDILVIAYIIYKAIDFLRESRAGQLVKGIIILLVVYAFADWWDLAILKWTLSKVMGSAIIAIAVIFQPELRRILERVGHTNFRKGQFFDDSDGSIEQSIEDISRASGNMQDKKVGALIVFERKTQLGEIIDTGTVIDAKVSPSMVNNLFFPNSPLHDGAMLIRDGRILAAGCILPLTQREDISLQLGTRHRAAIGMTENSDAVVLVVSEETGIISIVANGEIRRNFSPTSACAELKRLILEDNQGEDKSSKKIFGFLKKDKKEAEKGADDK